MPYNKMIFAENLRRYAAIRKENQTEIAKVLGISKATASAYFSGENLPRIDKVEILASHFGCKMSDLLEPYLPQMRLSDHEKLLILAYRAKPHTHAAIDLLLELTHEKSEAI